jgi:hypothetical protein
LVIVENPTVLPRHLKFNLKNALGFQTLVSAMMLKSNNYANVGSRGTRNSTVVAARAAEVMYRAESEIGTGDQNVTVLLSEIRDELRRHNQRANSESVAGEII